MTPSKALNLEICKLKYELFHCTSANLEKPLRQWFHMCGLFSVKEDKRDQIIQTAELFIDGQRVATSETSLDCAVVTCEI